MSMKTRPKSSWELRAEAAEAEVKALNVALRGVTHNHDHMAETVAALKKLVTDWREHARRVRPLESSTWTAEKRRRVAEWMFYTNRANEVDGILRRRHSARRKGSDAMRETGWAVIVPGGKLSVTEARLPVFWLKRVAQIHNRDVLGNLGHVVRVQVQRVRKRAGKAPTP